VSNPTRLTLITSPNTTWVPLFPLNAVLFPGGVLPLKVFETRYIDMMRECMRRDMPFGIVLIKSGQEVGQAAEPEAVGCLAHIVQWDMQGLGVMLLRMQGGERFRIRETRILQDNRLEAKVDMLASDIVMPITAVHVSCAKALKVVIDDIMARGPAEPAFDSPFALPMHYDETGWVANRWCEILPIPLKARQKLLELENAQDRLTIIHQYLQQHHIL
jgi:uncharacterized protein